MTAAIVSAPLQDALPSQGEALAKAPESARRTLATYDRLGLPYTLKCVHPHNDSIEALAEALDTLPEDIALTSLYRGKATRKPVLLIHSAATRVSDKLLSQLVGENLQRADADFVLRYVGFNPESVPPTGHLNRIPIIMDSGLTRFARIWCSAGAHGCFTEVPTLVLARTISARLIRLVV